MADRVQQSNNNSNMSNSNVNKCILTHDSTRYYVSLNDRNLTLTRVSSSLFGDKEVTYPISDVVGVQAVEKGGFTVLAVARTSDSSSSLKNYYFTLSPQHKDEKINDFMKIAQDKINPKKTGKKLLVLVNPFGGTGQAPGIWKTTEKMFLSAGIDVEHVETNSVGHAVKLASGLSLNDYYGIVCISGDGVMSEVVNGLLQRKDALDAIRAITLGIIPGGSGNGLAASISAVDPIIATLNIIKGETSPLDIFSCLQSGKHIYGFLSVSWAALGVIDLQSEKYRWLGPLRFDVKGLVEVFSCDSYPAKISFLESSNCDVSTTQSTVQSLTLQHISDNVNVDDHKKNTNNDNKEKWTTVEGNFSWFLATNTPQITTAKNPISPRTHLSDGCMELTYAPGLDRVEFAQLLLGIDEGTITKHPKVKTFKVSSFILEPEANTKAPISLDGERTDDTTIKVEVHPSLARVFVGETFRRTKRRTTSA